MLCIVSQFFSFFFFIITFRRTHIPEFRWSNGPLMPCFAQLFTAAVARAVSEPLQMDGSDKIYLQHCIHSIKTFSQSLQQNIVLFSVQERFLQVLFLLCFLDLALSHPLSASCRLEELEASAISTNYYFAVTLNIYSCKVTLCYLHP